MRIELKKRPKRVTILEGFPGFGLVATIATEFLIHHLKAEQIGKIWVSEIPPVIAVHDSEVIQPIGIYYIKAYNLVILHALTKVKGLEWELADKIVELSKLLDAKEIVSIEGIGTNDVKPNGIYYISKSKRKVPKMDGVAELKEGVIVGVTGALLLRDDLPFVSILAESSTALPDSRAAANIIKALDSYLNLKVDYKPLLKKADEFEKKVNSIVTKNKEMIEMVDQKEIVNYMG
jgi:uncharacterized protein